MSATPLRAVALVAVVGFAALTLGTSGAGVVTAAAGNVAVSPNPANASATVSVTATADAPGNDLTFAVDGDGDGTIEAGEFLGTVSSNGSTGEGTVSASLGPYVPSDGTYTVYVVEESNADGVDDTSYPVTDPAATYDADASVEVDDTPPTITDFDVSNPAEREVEVSFNASERLSAVRVAVDGPDGGTLTEGDVVSSGTGPYRYEATYYPALDGEYDVSLARAADTAGNDGAAGETASVLAATSGRDADSVFESSAPVFVGETGVDVSHVVGDGSVTLVGVGGAAAGTIVSGNASDLDVTAANGVRPGRYDATDDGDADLVVRRPAVQGPSAALETRADDVDVAGAYLQAGDAVTLRASFAFGVVDDLDVAVRDPAGLDVAPALTDEPVLRSGDDAIRLDTGAADLEPGTYTVVVSSDRLDARASTTFELVDRERSVSLDRTRVVRGRTVTATAFGPPGGTAVVRLPVTALANQSTTAAEVFESTGDVRNRTRGDGYVGVELSLGRDGIARGRFDTSRLEPGASAVALVDGSAPGLDGPSADSVPLDVAPRRVVVGDTPERVAINERMTVAGTAPQVAAVRAYARVDDTWYPLDESVRVDDDGTFELDIPVTGELAYPGVYQIAIVGADGPQAADLGGNETLDHGAVTSRPFDTFTVRTAVGG